MVEKDTKVEPTSAAGGLGSEGLAWALLDPSRAPTLLAGKLRVPRRRPHCLARPRLTIRLDESTRRPLTLISAPPGYGKTTVVSEWAAQTERRVAWVALDGSDNSPSRFWAYVMAAVRHLHAGVAEATWDCSSVGREQFDHDYLVSLLNEMDGFDDDIVLVLDDFQTIESNVVHEGVGLFIKHLPRGIHLVLVSRTDPPLPLARLRARGWLTEFRSADLAFTPEEARQFFDRPGVSPIDPADLAVLQESTQGWPVSLELAALALAGSSGPDTLKGPLRGSRQLITDFLMEEVLRQQSDAIRDFLLRTSVLEQLSASLCDYVLEDMNHASAETLETLLRSNMFLLAMDDEHEWFRYHPLVAEILRDQLCRLDSRELPRLLERASRWHQSRGRYADALSCAEVADDSRQVANIVAASRHALVERGEFDTLLEFVAKAADAYHSSSPGLALARAWACVPAGRFYEADEALGEATRLLDEGSATPAAERKALLGEIDAIRAVMDAFSNTRADVRGHCENALRCLPADRRFLRTLMRVCLGWALKVEGRLDEARLVLNETLDTGCASDGALLSALARYYLACIARREGKLHKAVALLREVLEIESSGSDQERPLCGPVHVSLGAVLYEWNELGEAERHLRLGLELSERWQSYDALWEGQFCLGWLLLSTGREEEAIGYLDRQLDLAPVQRSGQPFSSVSPFVTSLRIAHTARWQSKSSRNIADRMSSWCGRSLAEAEREEISRALQLDLQHAVSMLFVLGRVPEAEQLVDRLLPLAEQNGFCSQVIALLVAKALCSSARDDTVAALSALERALAMAERERYIRLFVDEGPAMRTLLELAVAKGRGGEHAARLLVAMIPPPLRQVCDEMPGGGPLSARELEVLRLAAAGLSRKQTAQRLVLSQRTVGNHLTRIYEKLAVHSRLQAVQRAGELGLLS
jgi:LuxR family maltose regulon positive regulatory protein